MQTILWGLLIWQFVLRWWKSRRQLMSFILSCMRILRMKKLRKLSTWRTLWKGPNQRVWRVISWHKTKSCDKMENQISSHRLFLWRKSRGTCTVRRQNSVQNITISQTTLTTRLWRGSTRMRKSTLRYLMRRKTWMGTWRIWRIHLFSNSDFCLFLCFYSLFIGM